MPNWEVVDNFNLTSSFLLLYTVLESIYHQDLWPIVVIVVNDWDTKATSYSSYSGVDTLEKTKTPILFLAWGPSRKSPSLRSRHHVGRRDGVPPGVE